MEISDFGMRNVDLKASYIPKSGIREKRIGNSQHC